MSHFRFRFRSGITQLQKVRVGADTVIEAGDLVWLDDDDDAAKPASDFPWTNDLATTQSNFAAVFLGVAHQPSAAGDITPISVDVSPLSVYEFDTNAAAYEVGDLLAPDEASSRLMSRQLKAVASGALGIARAVEYKPAASTTLRVCFASAFHTASSNASNTPNASASAAPAPSAPHTPTSTPPAETSASRIVDQIQSRYGVRIGQSYVVNLMNQPLLYGWAGRLSDVTEYVLVLEDAVPAGASFFATTTPASGPADSGMWAPRTVRIGWDVVSYIADRQPG